QQYLQRSNYLSTSALHAFGCRWQMFSCFFNFMVVPQKFQIKTIMTPYHLVRCHNLNRTMPRNRSHNGMMKLH
ncbi:hypothetical protein GAZ16_16175, partial [Bacteroides xylanisolvens]